MVKNQRNSCCHMGCPPMIGDLHFHRGYSLRLQESKPLKNNGIISDRRPEDAYSGESVDLATSESGLHRSHNPPRPSPPDPAGLVGSGANLASVAVCGHAGGRQASSTADPLPGAG